MSAISSVRRVSLVAAALTFVACGGDASKSPANTPSASAPTPGASKAPAPTGRSITIEMTSDEKGNYFKPNEIEAKPGDVLHFVLVTGVHNVHFLADSNPGATDLPPASAFAQLPGQATDIPVTMAPGKSYYFQCDPHAALGMKGHVKVEP